MDMSKEMELLRESWTETFDQLFVLYEISREVSFELDIDTVLTHVANHAYLLLESEASAILILNKDTHLLDFKTIQGDKAEELQKLELHLAVGEGLAGSIAQSANPEIISNPSIDDRIKKEGGIFSIIEPKNVICVPILLKQKVIGVIEVVNKKKKGGFTIKDRDFLMAIANISALAIENAQMYQNMKITENYQAQIIENLPDGFFSVNTSGKINYINSQAVKLLGLKDKNAVNESSDVILSAEEELLEYIRTGIKEGKAFRNKEYLIHGSDMSVFLSTFIFKAENGSITGVGVILQDMVFGGN